MSKVIAFKIADEDGQLEISKITSISNNDIEGYLKDFCENHFFANEDNEEYKVYTKYVVIDSDNCDYKLSDENDHNNDNIDIYEIADKFDTDVITYNPDITGQNI